MASTSSKTTVKSDDKSVIKSDDKSVILRVTLPQKVREFDCPQCGDHLKAIAKDITEHIKTRHPKIAQAMALQMVGRTAIHCKCCNRYTTFMHYHCLKCEDKHYYRNQVELFEHIKTTHNHPTKLWLETKCRNGSDCSNTKCGFNHGEYADKYILDNNIPESICSSENLLENKRCQDRTCNKDHYRGRVAFLRKTYISKSTTIIESIDEIESSVDEHISDSEEDSEVSAVTEIIEESKTEAAKVEAPKVEAPKVEKVEAPKVEAPKVEAPKVEKVEAPKVEAKVDAKIEAKVEEVEAPKVEAKVEAPKVEKVEAPKVEKVEAKVAPKVRASYASTVSKGSA